MEALVDKVIGVLAVAGLVAGEALGWGLSDLARGILVMLAGMSSPSVGSMVSKALSPAKAKKKG